jgi:L-fuconolactonase
MRIDAHQHFWELGRFPYPWMPAGDSPLKRNYLPGDLQPILEEHRFDGSVAVQAAQVDGEADWLLALAHDYPFIRGVVAWVDLTSPQLPARLDELQKSARFCGVRHIVEDEPDPEWLLRPAVIEGLRELERRDIPYDLLIRPSHLHIVRPLVDRVPRLRMVIDHLAKPLIRQGIFNGWAQELEQIAEIPHIYAKISGLITEADWRHWTAEQLRPYVQHALQIFSPPRLMFGSDWPVCKLAGSWKQVLAAFTQALGPQPAEVREQILGTTAAQFYRLR